MVDLHAIRPDQPQTAGGCDVDQFAFQHPTFRPDLGKTGRVHDGEPHASRNTVAQGVGNLPGRRGDHRKIDRSRVIAQGCARGHAGNFARPQADRHQFARKPLGNQLPADPVAHLGGIARGPDNGNGAGMEQSVEGMALDRRRCGVSRILCLEDGH
jgi:hypothetical protein